MYVLCFGLKVDILEVLPPLPAPQFTPKSCDATTDFVAVLEDKQWPDSGKDTHLG